MKEVKHYICDICGTEYNEKTKAKLCERKHCFPVEIVECRYVPYYHNEKGYPISVRVKMSDGEVVTFKR